MGSDLLSMDIKYDIPVMNGLSGNDKFFGNTPIIAALIEGLKGSGTSFIHFDRMESVAMEYERLRRLGGQELREGKAYLRAYFSEEMKRQGLDPRTYKDVQAYLTEKIPEKEFFCVIYLYIQVHFDTSDSNKIIKTPEMMFSSGQGECDDIAFFIDHMARKRGISGHIVHEDAADTDNYHVVYCLEQKEDIFVLDNNRYYRFSKGIDTMNSLGDVLYKHFPKVEKAAFIDDPWSRVGGKESELVDHVLSFPDERFFFIRSRYSVAY